MADIRQVEDFGFSNKQMRTARDLADYRIRLVGRGDSTKIGGDIGVVLKDAASAGIEAVDLDNRTVVFALDGSVAGGEGWKPAIAGEISVLKKAQDQLDRWANKPESLVAAFQV